MKHIRPLLLVLTLTLCSSIALTTSAATITPSYDSNTAYTKYWTRNFKDQVTAACNFVGGYIGDNVTITLTVTIGNATTVGNNYATGKPDTSTTNTDTKFTAATGTIYFNGGASYFNGTEWTGNNILLMVHEIFHCLGFTSSKKSDGTYVVPAFGKKITIDGTKATFTGANVKRLNDTQPYPLNSSTDTSHFKRELDPPQAGKFYLDKAGVAPRMMAGGGNTLSLIDLAVLADIGYTIPTVTSATRIYALGFKLGIINASRYNQPQFGATLFIAGEAGNDTISGENATETVILEGRGGNDTLITGNIKTVLVGDVTTDFENGTDGSDIFKITTNFPHAIAGFGANDKLYLSTKLPSTLNITATTISNLKVESLQVNSQADADFINANYPTQSFGPAGTPVWYSARKVTIGTYVFYCYAKNSFTNDQLKERLKTRIFIQD